MVYTLVSAATLGFDLARLPAGREVAGVLLTGLLADGPALHRLARQHRSHCVLDDPRTTRRADAGQTRRARELAASGGTPLTGLAPDGEASAATLVAQLERSTLGDVTALDRLVHGELVDPPAEVDERTAGLAREVLADAAVAAYAAPVLPPDLRRLLRAAHDDAVGPDAVVPFGAQVPTGAAPVPAVALGPQGERVLEVLAAVAAVRGDLTGRARWSAAAGSARDGTGDWARALHDACWAAHLSGRTRVTAAAQLLAVSALHDGGFTAGEAAGGVWNALAGVVQGLVLADLLTDELLAQLLAPWVAATSA